jgi:putative ABC transport system permease protein
MQPVGLTPELDRAAVIGFDAATRVGEPDRTPSIVTVYVRVRPQDTERVQAVLARTANPLHPNAVSISRPSDALAARTAADQTLRSLLVGLGAIALVVAGLGVANVMAVAVLERRTEIGLRRALGATRRNVGAQFLAEALVLAGVGGVLGAVAGSVVTAGWAAHRGWTMSLPVTALGLGIGAAMAVGAVAGLYPALHAARLAPTDALRAGS